MAYNKTLWQNNSLPAINEGNLNKIEQGIYEAHENIGNINDLQYDTNLVGAINSIIESGSNENGNWIKYADGSMLCWRKINIIVNITSAWGNLYYGSNTNIWNFSQEFISIPNVLIDLKPKGAIGFFEINYDAPEITTSHYKNIYLGRPTSATGVQAEVTILAIGRWK